VVITDCELERWTKSGVQVASDVPSVGREWAAQTRVEHNFIHDNARDGGGHGVCVSYGVYVTIEGDVFDFNRHAVEAEGYCGGYVARFNYVCRAATARMAPSAATTTSTSTRTAAMVAMAAGRASTSTCLTIRSGATRLTRPPHVLSRPRLSSLRATADFANADLPSDGTPVPLPLDPSGYYAGNRATLRRGD